MPAAGAQSSVHTPDFVVVGNVARDVIGDGWLPGGTVVYAAAVAAGLGRSVGVVTAAPDDLARAGFAPAIAVACAAVSQATSFENRYTPAGRIQYLRAAGQPIPLSTRPAAWRAARVVLLGPVYHEVSDALAAGFTGSVGVCAQGFLRRAGPDGRVGLMPPASWDALPVLRAAQVLFLSEEDLSGGAGSTVPNAWLEATPVTVLTRGRRGARVHADGRWLEVPAVTVDEVDPTGAGDSFAAAFMIARDEGAGLLDAARFATAVASFVVETAGRVAPPRDRVLARVRSVFDDAAACANCPPSPLRSISTETSS